MKNLLGCLLTCLLIANAQAGLIGLTSGAPGTLYSIDESTGQATEIANTAPTSFVGLTFLGGDLYASDVCDNNCYSTGKINIVSGQYTFVSNQDGSYNWHGLASNESAGLIYAIDINDSNKLKAMNAVGSVTTIGNGTGIDGRGMAYDDGNGVLYATGGNGGLYSVDTTLGTSTLIGAMGIYTGMIGLAFDENTGTLYANNDAGLYSIDTLSGAASFIGSNNTLSTIDGLAWYDTASVPSPSSIALIALGLGLMGFSRKKRLA